MKKYLDVMLDLETLSLRPTAAIIQIAAVPFRQNGDEVKKSDGSDLSHGDLTIDINATTCAMNGFDFDMGTVNWWKSNTPANEHFKNAERVWYSIDVALLCLSERLKEWKDETGSDDIIAWSQGTDFDIAVLRNAYRTVFGNEKQIPWKYNNVRDARTYFLEAVRLFAPDTEKPYDIIKTDGTKHLATDDCLWSIAAVQWAHKKIQDEIDLSAIR